MTDFSEVQNLVLSALRDSRDSVLITGVAGCGKSTLLRHWIQDSGESVMVLAPTGIAALNVGGSTIHRAFGFHPSMNTDDPQITLKTRSLLYAVTTIVIDEISMVRADLLSAMDIVLRSVKRKRDLPFGGVRMVMVGDFYQLPPVVQQDEERWMERYHGSRAGWVFFAPCFLELKPRVFFLGQSFRQAGDGSYTELLNGVRRRDSNVVGGINAVAKQGSYAGDSVPRLCARRADVANQNAKGLRKLAVPTVSVRPAIFGDASKVPKDACTNLILAEGARVMVTRNGQGYVNGSLGTLRSFDARAELWNGEVVPAIAIELDRGFTVNVPREDKEIIGYETNDDGKLVKNVLATVSQFPLELGYAWTIHKSQGQTLDRACIDLGRGAFAHGQTYVALSRLTSGEGLYLSAPLTKSDLLLDPDVVSYFEQYVV